MLASATRRRLAAALLVVPLLAACSADRPTPTESSPRLAKESAGPAPAGAVYTMTDAAAGNAILAFARAADGSLTPLGAFPTGGRGSGIASVDPLASQNSVRPSDDHRFLFAVNAGSGDVSVFGIDRDGSLSLIDRESSGGRMPVSVAEHDRLVYVLNAGDGTLQGLKVGGSGKLNPVPHSRRELDVAAGQGANVAFTPDGRRLVVSIKGGPDSRILVFPVLANGRLGEPTRTVPLHPSAFGFDITRDDHVLVSETSGFASSYRLAGVTPTPVSSMSTAGAAPCWLSLSPDGRFAYVANAASATIAGFAVAGGLLTPIAPGVIVGSTPAGSAPLDLDLSDDGRFLYVLEGATGAIARFAVDADGTLAGPAMTAASSTARLQGLVAF